MKNQKNFILIILVMIIAIAATAVLINRRTTGNTPSGQTPQGETDQVQKDTPSATAFYSCNEGKTIQADFYNKEPQAPAQPGQPPVPQGKVKIKLSDGRSMELNQTISADGSRYANPDESFVFWSKGNGALVLENNQEKSFIGCVVVTPQPAESDLSRIYSSGAQGFSIRLPQNYTVDESYKYQLNPNAEIGGVKFRIPESITAGTNLSTDTYISIEEIPQTQNCSASLFLDGDHPAQEKVENGQTYSFAESSNAGAGNRYEETVYAIPQTNPCVAVRYFVHYGVIQNYPDNIKEFDKQSLIGQFDQIRNTLIVNQ